MPASTWKRAAWELTKYTIAGTSATIINIASFQLLNRLLSVDYRLSDASSTALSIIVAYLINRFFVFKVTPGRSKTLIAREVSLFFVGRLSTMGLEVLGIMLLVGKFGLSQLWSKVLLTALNTLINYAFTKWIVFRTAPSKTVRVK